MSDLTKKQVKETAVIPIDWKIVAQLLQAGNSGVGIASRIGIHENTLYHRCKLEMKMDFVAFKAQKKSEGDDLIHTKQFETAMEGNVTMLIWIGKQRLGQKDRNDLTSNDQAIFVNRVIEPKQIDDDAS